MASPISKAAAAVLMCLPAWAFTSLMKALMMLSLVFLLGAFLALVIFSVSEEAMPWLTLECGHRDEVLARLVDVLPQGKHYCFACEKEWLAQAVREEAAPGEK